MPPNNTPPPVTPPPTAAAPGRSAFIAASLAMQQQNGALDNVRADYRNNQYQFDALGEDATVQREEFRAQRSHETQLAIEESINNLSVAADELRQQGQLEAASEQESDIERLRSIDVNVDGFDMDPITKSFTDTLDSVLKGFGNSTRTEMKVSMSRMKALMDGLEASNAVEKDFLLEQYGQAQAAMQQEYNKRASVAARATESLANLGEQYLDISSMYAGFVDNNPLAMGIFKLGADFLRRSRENKKAQREAREQDAFNLQRAAQVNETNMARAEIAAARDDEMASVRSTNIENDSISISDMFSGIQNDDDVPDQSIIQNDSEQSLINNSDQSIVRDDTFLREVQLPDDEFNGTGDEELTEDFMREMFSGIQNDDDTTPEQSIIREMFSDTTTPEQSIVRDNTTPEQSIVQNDSQSLINNSDQSIIRNDDTFLREVQLPDDEFNGTGDEELTEDFMREMFSGIQNDDDEQSIIREMFSDIPEQSIVQNDSQSLINNSEQSIVQNDTFVREVQLPEQSIVQNDSQSSDQSIVQSDSEQSIARNEIQPADDDTALTQDFIREMFDSIRIEDVRVNDRQISEISNPMRQMVVANQRDERTQNEYFFEDSVRMNNIATSLVSIDDSMQSNQNQTIENNSGGGLLEMLGGGKLATLLPKMAMFLGPAVAAIIGGAGGAAIGTWINSKLSDETKIAIGDAIGSTVDFMRNSTESISNFVGDISDFFQSGEVTNFIRNIVSPELGDKFGTAVDSVTDFTRNIISPEIGDKFGIAVDSLLSFLGSDNSSDQINAIEGTNDNKASETIDFKIDSIVSPEIGDKFGMAVDSLLSFFGSDKSTDRINVMKFEVPVQDNTRDKTEAIINGVAQQEDIEKSVRILNTPIALPVKSSKAVAQSGKSDFNMTSGPLSTE